MILRKEDNYYWRKGQTQTVLNRTTRALRRWEVAGGLLFFCLMFALFSCGPAPDSCTTACGVYMYEDPLTCRELSDMEAAALAEFMVIGLGPNLCPDLAGWRLNIIRTVPDTANHSLGAFPDPWGRKNAAGEVMWIAGYTDYLRREIGISFWPGEWQHSAFAHELAHVAQGYGSDYQHTTWKELGIWDAIYRAEERVANPAGGTRFEAWERALSTGRQ